MLGRFANVLNLTHYNGYSFPAKESIETTAYKVTAHYDTARRTVIYSTFDVTIRWRIADAEVTSPEVQDMVARLQRPAGVLEYTGRGYGVAEQVNRGRVRDVDWGPRPGTVELQPVGAGRGVDATWSVQFSIPTCDDALFKNAVREFCFSIEYDKSRAGLTVRTYKAHASVAVTRRTVDARDIPDTADRLLEQITPPPLLGYQRETQNHSLSEDKSTIFLTVVDSELPAFAPPPGCVSAKVEHTYGTQPGNFTKWVSTLTGTYEVAKSATTGADTARTIEDFLARAESRLAEVATMVVGRGVPAVVPGAGAPVTRRGIIPVGFTVSEPDVYGPRQIRISMSYFIAGIGLSEILGKGGLWLPWGTQYNVWQQRTPTIHAPRGVAGLVFSAGDDRIVDLCGPGDPKAPGALPAGGGGPFGGSQSTRPNAVPQSGIRSVGQMISRVFPGPDPATSWVEYQCHTAIAPDTGRVVGKTLPASPIATGRGQSGWNVMGGVTAALPSGTAFPPLQQQFADQRSGGETFVHQRTKPTLYVTISGHAVRVGFPVPVPGLVSINGQAATLVGKPLFTSGVVGNANVPVYGARWNMTYVATADRAAAAPVPTPPNPFLA